MVFVIQFWEVLAIGIPGGVVAWFILKKLGKDVAESWNSGGGADGW